MKIKRFRSFLCFILVLAMAVCSVSSVTAYAALEGGSGASNSGSIPTSGSDNAKAGDISFYEDSTGYRIYLAPQSIYDESAKQVVSNSFNRLNYFKSYAIYEVSYGGGGSVGTNSYSSQLLSGNLPLYTYVWDSLGNYQVEAVVLRNRSSSLNTNPTFKELVGSDFSSFDAWSFSSSNSNLTSGANWANSVFKSDAATTGFLETFLVNYYNLLADKFTTSELSWVPTTADAFKEGEFCLIFEPVLIMSLVGTQHYTAISYQDWFASHPYSMQSFKNAQYNSYANDRVRKASDFYVEFTFTLDGTKVTTKDTEETGWGMYWNTKSGTLLIPDDESASVGTNIAIYYDGVIKDNLTSVATKSQYSTVISRYNPITAIDVKTIALATSDDAKATQAALELDSWGSALVSPLAKAAYPARPSLYNCMVGVATGWANDLILTEYITYKASIPVGSDLLSKFYKTVPNVTASTQKTGVSGGSVNAGYKYSMSFSLPLQSVASGVSLANSTLTAMYPRVTNTDPTVDSNLVISNLSLYALKNSSISKIDEKTSKYTAVTDDHTAISVEFLVKKTNVSSYLVKTKNDNSSLTYQSSSDKTYTVTEGGKFTETLSSVDNYVAFFPDSTAGTYKLSGNKNGSKLITALTGKTYTGSTGATDLKNDLTALGIPNVTVVKLGKGTHDIVVGATPDSGGNLGGYDVLIISGGSSTTTSTAVSGDMAVMDYELNYFYPTLTSTLYGIKTDNYIVDSLLANDAGTQHSHSGSSSSGGACYTWDPYYTQKSHSHTSSCTKVTHSGTYTSSASESWTCGGGGGWFHEDTITVSNTKETSYCSDCSASLGYKWYKDCPICVGQESWVGPGFGSCSKTNYVGCPTYDYTGAYVLSCGKTAGTYYNWIKHSLAGVAADTYHVDNTIIVTDTGSGDLQTLHGSLGIYKNIFYYQPSGVFKPRTPNSATFGPQNISSVKFNYATNLTRGLFGDKMAVSSIHPTTTSLNSNNFLTSNLGLSITNKGSIASVSSTVVVNSSSATLSTTKKDDFNWKANRKMTYLMPQTCTCTYDDNGTTKTKTHTVMVPYEDTVFTNNADDIKYSVTEICYKYIALNRSVGTNITKKVSSVVASDSINLASVDSALTYKSSSVNASSKVLNFYPEVVMRAYKPSVTDTFTSAITSSTSSNRINTSSQLQTLYVWMMGERLRSVQPSGLYLLTVSGTGNSSNVTGALTSTTFATGTRAKSLSQSMNNLPIVYAGGDINLKTSGNFSINMTGYAVDQLETSDSSIKSTWGSTYSSVVADGTNIKSIWGSDTSYKPLDEYKAWVSSVIDNLQVDMTLKTTTKAGATIKTYNNFSTSLGLVSGGSTTNGAVYNIQFQGGDVVDDTAYQALISSIASKYYNTSSPTTAQLTEAKTIFKNSGLYTSILSAIESNTDFDNQSQATTFTSNKKWYDEVVRTFVIREYNTTAVKLPNIILSDKIDMGAGVTQDNYNRDALFSSGYYGKWYLTVYLKSALSTLPAGVAYKPSLNNMSTANSSRTVLAQNIYVNGTDFIIPDATTADMNK